MTWTRVLTDDVLAEIFTDRSLRILRDARNIGGLSEGRYDDPEAFIEHYQRQEQRLCDFTQDWYHGDYDDVTEMRSEITKLAKGLSGSIAQLLDLGDPAVIVDHRVAALHELCDEWPWLQSILPFVKAACESPEPDPNANPVLMGPTLSQQPLTTMSAGATG